MLIPYDSYFFLQILTMGFLRIISIAYLFKFNKIVAQCNR